MAKMKDFVIFRAGKYPQGTYTESDLDEMAKNFNASDAPHVIIGHSSDYKGKTMIPSFGQILGGLKRVGSDLVAIGAEFADELAEWISKGYFNQRSVELAESGGKKRILALGMLGACPPAVKNLPVMKLALNEFAERYAPNENTVTIDAEAVAIAFADDKAIDAVEQAFTEDTVKDCTEACATFVATLEESLAKDIDEDERKKRIYNAMYDLDNSIYGCLGMHFTAMQKLENLEEHAENEMSERIGKVKEFFKQFIHGKRKEIEVDAKERKEYTDRISALEAQVKEFSDEKAAQDAEAEAARVKAEGEAKDAKLKAGIHEFCEKSGRPSKAIEEQQIESKMFDMAKALNVQEFAEADAQAKSVMDTFSVVLNAIPTVQTGAMNKEFSEQENKPEDNRPSVIKAAEKYATEHAKEFAQLSKKEAVAKVLQMNMNGQIKLEVK